MEIKKFLLKLWHYRLILVIVPVVTVIIAYLLVRNMADTYISKTQIGTGLVDETQHLNFSDSGSPKGVELQQEFGNLIEMIKTDKMLGQVSYKLIIHDLTSDRPYRPISKEIQRLGASGKKEIIRSFSKHYYRKEGLNLWIPEEKRLHLVLQSMGYDNGSLGSKLIVYRNGNSDFINVEHESEDPELSAFVANTVTSEFITYYTNIIKENQRKSVAYLKRLLTQKQDSMNAKISELRAYRIQNQILNLSEQSSQLYSQSLSLEQEKLQAEKLIAANEGTIKSIERRFSPGERKYMEATVSKINQEIMGTKDQMRSLTDLYISSDFDTRYKSSLDSLKDVVSSQINELTDKYIYNPLSTKQELFQQKLNMELQVDLTRYGLDLVNGKLSEINSRLYKLVPHEAVLQALERDIDVATKEYLEVLNKYNDSSMEEGYSIKLRQVQPAMPGLPQPSKKMLLIILSGIISFTFSLVVLFILFLLDQSINDSSELAQRTQLPVLGSVSGYPGVISFPLDLKITGGNGYLRKLRDEFRALRFEVDKEITGYSRVLAISSICPRQGKTFISLTLAEAYSMMNKRVLVIDGNFINPSITRMIKPAYFIEELLENSYLDFYTYDSITFLGNRGGDESLLELSKAEQVSSLFNKLRSQFDIIIIETASLTEEGQAREWLLVAQKVLGVFGAHKSISDEQAQYVSLLRSQNEKFIGWILNDVGRADVKQERRIGLNKVEYSNELV